jgi:hypothetical protein
MGHVIGIDFDNTVVSYDDVMHEIAVQQGLIPSDTRKSKKHIRDRTRQLPGGEIKWQRLQAKVYGPRMGEARLIEGVREFAKLCKKHRVQVCIVSHKTEYANYDETRTNLRAAALSWMMSNRFFDAEGLGLSQGDVYFEATRQEKIGRIRSLGCTHFVDDLEETFLEDSFPADVEKILYAPHVQHGLLQRVRVVTTWEEISDYFFGRSRPADS